jgi:lipid-binding SYLF domain-containing protein
MRKIFTALTVIMCLMMTVTTVFAAKGTPAEQRAQIDELSKNALKLLYEKYPNADRVIAKTYAWATISSTSTKIGIFGSSHGRGIAVNNKTGERVYLKMNEQSAGLGVGVKEYNLIFLIANKDAWDGFIAGKIRFGASIEASADDGVNGGTAEGADYVAPGVYVYQMTTKGLALDAMLKGIKIKKDKKLNEPDKD